MDRIVLPMSPQGRIPEAVRQCGICHKPFLKESSYNRHLTYCRRTRQRTRTRARVCQACSLAKVKCNLQPQCQRCTAKGIVCVYDAPQSSLNITRKQRFAEDSQAEPSPQSRTTGWSADEVNTPISNELYTQDDAEGNQVDWNLLDFDESPIMSQSPKNSYPCLPEMALRAEGLTSGHPSGKDIIDYGAIDFDPQIKPPWNLWNEPGKESPHALARTTCLVDQMSSQHLSPILSADARSCYTAKVVMEMLRAYPQMMVRRETLPPFVHGNWYQVSAPTELVLPQPLLNCMGIAQVFASRTPETRSFLWRTIQQEQSTAIEKADRGELSKHVLLASIQAQLIFIIMRINDQSLADPGLNFQLLVIFQRLCEKFKELCNQPFFQQESHYPSPSWEDWIFAESRRRTAIVWLLVTQMVHIKIGVACDSFEHFREIPLPAPRSLWEARTRTGWQSELEMHMTTPSMGMETIGDLIITSGQCDTSMNKLRLNVWNAGIDNLGLLLNLSVVAM